MRGITRCLVLLAIAPLIDVAVAFGQSAGDSDSSKTGTAADIVKQIISNEAKVDQLESLYLRLLGKWTNTPEGISARIEELKKQHAVRPIDEETHPELRTNLLEQIEIAFDDHHQRKLENRYGYSYKLQVWDGARTTVYERPIGTKTECYGLSKDPPGSQTLFGDLNGFRFNARLMRSEHREGNAKSSFDLGGLPEDYQFAGEQDYRGRRCTVLENRARRQRLFVGTRDRRLYGLLQLGGPNHADEMVLFRRVTGQAFETDDAAKQWYARQEPAKIEELRAKISEMEYDVSQPFADYFLDDYRELAPVFGSQPDKAIRLIVPTAIKRILLNSRANCRLLPPR